MTSAKGYIFVLAATLFWGMAAVIAKSLFNQQVDTLILVQMRVTLSCLVMLAFYLAFRRDILRVRARDLYRFALLGVIGVAGSNYTYYFTIQQINVSTAILIQYTAPLFVVAYAALTKEESLNATKIIAAIVSLGGCYFAVGGRDIFLPSISKLGLVSGVGAALCWAFANVYLRRLLRDYSVWTILAYAFSFATLFWMFVNSPWNVAARHYSREEWSVFFGFAIISVLIPHSLYFIGVRYISASRAIITGTFEPIVAILGSSVFLGDLMMPLQLFGAMLVIVAIALLQLKREEAEVLAAHPEREKEGER